MKMEPFELTLECLKEQHTRILTFPFLMILKCWCEICSCVRWMSLDASSSFLIQYNLCYIVNSYNFSFERIVSTLHSYKAGQPHDASGQRGPVLVHRKKLGQVQVWPSEMYLENVRFLNKLFFNLFRVAWLHSEKGTLAVYPTVITQNDRIRYCT